ncbi:MAG: peptidoglycan recognition family protein [Verrucomicrobiota bacterium]
MAYHYLIGPSGTIYEGRSESTAPSSGTIYLTEAQWEAAGQDEQGKTTAAKPGGSAKPGASAGHLTICFLGTYHDALPTQEAQDAFLWLAREKMNEHEIPLERVLFHREIACWTDCPGQALYDWFRGPERRRGMLGPGLKKLQAYQSKEKL